MATSKDFKEFILEQLNLLDEITCKPMMGEYLLYYNGLFPYETAKPMYMIEDVENSKLIRDIVIDTCKGLKKK